MGHHHKMNGSIRGPAREEVVSKDGGWVIGTEYVEYIQVYTYVATISSRNMHQAIPRYSIREMPLIRMRREVYTPWSGYRTRYIGISAVVQPFIIGQSRGGEHRTIRDLIYH
jgi:hypothetical protein